MGNEFNEFYKYARRFEEKSLEVLGAAILEHTDGWHLRGVVPLKTARKSLRLTKRGIVTSVYPKTARLAEKAVQFSELEELVKDYKNSLLVEVHSHPCFRPLYYNELLLPSQEDLFYYYGRVFGIVSPKYREHKFYKSHGVDFRKIPAMQERI